MYTCRSFLAFAAAAQVINPSVGAVVAPGAAKRMVAERLPRVLLQAHPGRDVHFFNDRSTGQLSILDLHVQPRAQVPDGAGDQLPVDLYQYSLTRQPAIRDDAELRRYMAWYGAAAGAARPPAAASGVELLRLRFGVLVGAP